MPGEILLDKKNILLALISIVIIISFVLRIIFSQSRSRSIYAISERLGYSFMLFDDGHVLDSLKAFPMYNVGHDRDVSNIMEKTLDNMEITVFDYKYTTFKHGCFKGPSHNFPDTQTVMFIKPKAFAPPVFELHPKKDNPGISENAFEYFNKQSIMSVESNKNGIIIYDKKIVHPPEDLEIIILQRLRFVELISKNPTGAMQQ